MIESRVRDASPRVLSVKFCRSTRGSEEGGAVQRASRQCPRTTGCTFTFWASPARVRPECVQYRRRRSTDGIAVLAHDSDGSPPGCLIIGSTGQEVIHVYERQHAAV